MNSVLKCETTLIIIWTSWSETGFIFFITEWCLRHIIIIDLRMGSIIIQAFSHQLAHYFILHLFLVGFFFLCVYACRHSYTCMCRFALYLCVQACVVWEPEVDVDCLPQLLSTLNIKQGLSPECKAPDSTSIAFPGNLPFRPLRGYRQAAWALKIWTLVLILVSQRHYPLRHLPALPAPIYIHFQTVSHLLPAILYMKYKIWEHFMNFYKK